MLSMREANEVRQMRINNSSILKMASSQDLSVFQWRCSSSLFLQKKNNNNNNYIVEESIQIENELKYVVKSSSSSFFYKKKTRFFDIPLYISRIFGDNFNNVYVMCLFHPLSLYITSAGRGYSFSYDIIPIYY